MNFLKGLAFGFLLAASVGPLWILCFRRTLALTLANPATILAFGVHTLGTLL